MPKHVCPWWVGYLLASPVRRWIGGSPERLLAPYVKEGMTVVEPGPGMGFFTLPLARMVGPAGRVIAVDIQPRMLESLQRRAAKARLSGHIVTHLAQPDRMGIPNSEAAADLVLAFAVVHEMPSVSAFFAEAAELLKPGGILLFAEPKGHVNTEAFAAGLETARSNGLKEVARPAVRRSHAAVLKKA